ncbi:hypothetical protein [Mycobacteroides immunogenum]|uniref:GP55 protein n=1 Tax=Mycobacteroides immunogenum TaxID=83262 RepID=A0A7V8LQY3_9MYCO|nr:hypothetical protein [Mycobacteroides immunogenum]KPG13699.1 hypothetical protein AN909_05385 [Mycobacteroides immunogenum]KPG14313.1 hypothetical protein AN908_07025 [Mycobacteroides immunogenum]KPG14381.1 hypothetical protein AN908_07480 [Mycobacteroides immunogenum]KPG17413.1 hypothetical protein AN910_04610 [Mycobacteroides immunogenum]KPG24004.1 hypothetical protein AN911_00555 [Mycobacteroides immunogenum]
MAIATLILITVATMCWSLWIRKMTWSVDWELAATINIALQCAAVILMSPWASETIGVWLHDLTGQYNLEDWLAHDLYIVAASAIVFNALGRFGSDVVQSRFKRYVELPATLCIPLMFATFTAGAGVEIYRADFFRVPTDIWLTTYWFIMCGTLIYLLGYGWRALIPMWRTPGSRRLATLYFASTGAGIAACAARMATSLLPHHIQDTHTASIIVWALACACGAGFAAIAGWMWRAHLRSFTSTGQPEFQDH